MPSPPLHLHVLTRPDDDLARHLIAAQQAAGVCVETADLTEANPDYQRLLEKVFAAESVQVW